MKKKKFEPQMPNVLELKERFLMEMIDVYNREEDGFKSKKMRQCVSEYVLSNYDVVQAILDCNEKRKGLLNWYFFKEKADVMGELKNYKTTIDRLALVSVDFDLLHDKISPITAEQRKIGDGYSDGVKTCFKKGEIWEYAILSNDKNSFMLLRDVTDCKIQPIENCKVWGNRNVTELLEKGNVHFDASLNKKTYTITYFPTSLSDSTPGINEFSEKDVKAGILLDELFEKSYAYFQKQIITKMNARVKGYREKLREEIEKQKYDSRETLEF